jgi:hypothetical protein
MNRQHLWRAHHQARTEAQAQAVAQAAQAKPAARSPGARADEVGADLSRALRTPQALAGQPPVAFNHAGVQLRCFIWLLCICIIDLSTKGMALALVTACTLDLWLLSRAAQPGQGTSMAMAHIKLRFHKVPLTVWWFVGVMLLNLALEEVLVERVSRPFLINILILHGIMLVWACLTTPASHAARAALRQGATVLICVFGAILLVQLVLQFGVGYTLDVREILTGEASRSGIEEDKPGERPTAVFMEPSNLAVVVFMLLFVARLTGPASTWLTVVAALTCLLNNSGIGFFLAAYLLAETALVKLKQHLVLVPLIVAAVLALAAATVMIDFSELKIGPLERMLRPQTRYDPVAMRLYIPLSIANYDAWQHLIGTGIANYAAFKDGYTQYDSSFVLGLYFQTGLLSVPFMLAVLYSAWRVGSWRALGMMLVLFATKISPIMPGFWGLIVLLALRGAVRPVPGRRWGRSWWASLHRPRGTTPIAQPT